MAKRLTTIQRKRRDKLIVADYLRRHSLRKCGEIFGISRMTVFRALAKHASDLERSASVGAAKNI